MSRYFSEAMNNHPEIQRLKQRIRDLERENEEWQDKYRYACEEIIDRRRSAQVYNETIEEQDERMIAFNKLSFYKKMFFHFLYLKVMQVFVPYQNPFDCAQTLDPRRFNKQILECKQILKAIRGESTAWANHPCVLMYKDHAGWLQCYLYAFECFKAYKDLADDDYDEAMVHYFLAKEWGDKAMSAFPLFLTDSFTHQHRKRLYTKYPLYYNQWAELGTSDENWYYVNGEWRIYINGRIVKVVEEL